MRYLLSLLCALLLTDQALAIELNAKAYIVAHPETDTVVLEKNADEHIEPASLTKLMTVYILFDALKHNEVSLETEFPISEAAWRKGGSKMFLEVGKTAKVEDLIKGILVSSGNDACMVVAESLSGSEEAFATLMNEKAKKLGMKNTHFVNSNGWPDEAQYTTARDMYQLSRAIIRDFPEYYAAYFSIPEFTYSNIKQPNRNGLINDPSLKADGLKTGHVESAGYHLAASAVQNGERLIAVVLGTDGFSSRERESKTGLMDGFRRYKMVTTVEKGVVVESVAPVWLGTQKTVKLVADSNLKVYMEKREADGITAKVNYTSPLEAPLKAGQKVGTVEVFTGTGKSLGVVDIAVSVDVDEQGFPQKIISYLRHGLGI